METISGNIRKMHTELTAPVSYALPIGDERLPMNELIGKSVGIDWDGQINCVHCGRQTKKSFSQGFCFPCFKKLAQCDSCIVKPELCHFHLGTCREPEWGETHCFIPHYVYLANSSGMKVGITRHSQIPTRWMDQGASQALPIFRVDNRLQSGLVETAFKDFIADKTDWRKMLKGEPEQQDMLARRDELLAEAAAVVEALREAHGEDAIVPVSQSEVTEIQYPVSEYPVKVKSFNLDKEPHAEGSLMGIKGQYLIFDTGVINVRKYGGYRWSLSF
ncbi:MAG: DUF2797 domain-containing protein [Gammaproteobacteria bacterium]